MKKTIALLLAMLLCLCLCACGRSGSSKGVVFQNDLSVTVCGLHITPVTSDTWGDALNDEWISAGSSFEVAYERLGGGELYDVGLIDINFLNYDIFDVTLAVGDTLTISVEDVGAVLTVTGADGSTNSYTARIYKS